MIGAGTYATKKCAISCTGEGEYFIRTSAASRLSLLHEEAGLSVQESSAKTIQAIGKLGGRGGLIALDVDGNVALEYNTAGMFRAYIRTGMAKPFVAINSDAEPLPE